MLCPRDVTSHVRISFGEARVKVLIADDDREILQTLSIGLRAAGHQVRTVQDAMQAFLQSKKHTPDVILLDINMPGGNGVDVLRLLKTTPATKNVPVVIITASGDAGLPERVKSLGAAHFIAKPFEFAALNDCLSVLTAKPQS